MKSDTEDAEILQRKGITQTTQQSELFNFGINNTILLDRTEIMKASRVPERLVDIHFGIVVSSTALKLGPGF